MEQRTTCENDAFVLYLLCRVIPSFVDEMDLNGKSNIAILNFEHCMTLYVLFLRAFSSAHWYDVDEEGIWFAILSMRP